MSLPTPPAGTLDKDQPWYRGRISDAQWDRLKAKLTGGRDAGGTTYSRIIDCSDAEADKIISNMKKDPRGYPQINMPGGAEGYENMYNYYTFLKDAYLYDEPKPEPEDIPVEVEVVEVEQKTVDEPIVIKIEAPFEPAPEQKRQAPKRIRLPRRSGLMKARPIGPPKKSVATRMAEAFDSRLDDLVDTIQNPPAPAPQKQRKQKESLVKIRSAVKPKSKFKEGKNVKPFENTSLFVFNKVKGAFKRAADARKMAQEQGLPEQEERYYVTRALGFEFGGDAIARTKGTFSRSPDATLDPALSKQERYTQGLFGTRTIRPPKQQKEEGDINIITKQIAEIDKKFDGIIKTKSEKSEGQTDTLENVLEELKRKLQSGNKLQKDINDKKKKLLAAEAKAADQAQSAAEEAEIDQSKDLSDFEDMYESPEETGGGEGEEDDGDGGLDIDWKKFKAKKWLRRLRNPGRFARSLGRLTRMRVGRFLRPAGQIGSRLATGAKGLVTGGAAASAAIVLGVGAAASGIGEGLFQLTKKGGAGEQTRDALKKKGEEIGGPMGSLIGGVGNLAGFSTEATKVTGNALDAIGAPFRYAIEGIRYPFLNEEDRKKQADNLAKFDARIREYSRGWMNRIDFMNVVPDEKGGFGNIYGNNDAQKEMMEKMSEGGTIPLPTFQGINGARLTGDAGGVNAMIGEAGPEMLLRAGQAGMNPLQSLAPMILAAREVTKRAGTWADPIENFVRQTTDPIAKSLNLPVSPMETEIGKGSIPQIEDKKEEGTGPLGWLAKLFKKRKKKIGKKGSRSSGISPVPVTGIPLGPGQTAKAGELVAGLMSRGFTREESAAIVGNLWAESGFNTGAVNPDSGAFGLMQWLGGRKNKLIAFAREKGKDVKDIGLQLDYIAWELKGGNQYETSQFQKAMAYGPDIASKTRGFAHEVERAGAHELAASMSKRIGAGESAFNASAGAAAPPAAPVAQQPAPPQPLLPPTQPSVLTLPLLSQAPPASQPSSIFSYSQPQTSTLPFTSYDELRRLSLGVR